MFESFLRGAARSSSSGGHGTVSPEDLYDYLTAVQLVVPPLRERREDVLVIAEHVLETQSANLGKSFNGFAQPSRELLLHYSFPGNVGELEQMVERAVALGQEGEALQPWNLCGFQTCPYLGGAPQAACGFCAEGLAAETKKPVACRTGDPRDGAGSI